MMMGCSLAIWLCSWYSVVMFPLDDLGSFGVFLVLLGLPCWSRCWGGLRFCLGLLGLSSRPLTAGFLNGPRVLLYGVFFTVPGLAWLA